MGSHIRLPGHYPQLAFEASVARSDPYAGRRLLAIAASGGPALHAQVVVAGRVFSGDLERTLLVRHPRFGWLSPGGRLEEGETAREGALREVTEETGIHARLLVREPAAVLGEHHAGGRTYGLAYALTANHAESLRPESGQPASWFRLNDLPPSHYPLDHPTLLAFARHLGC